VRLACNLQTEFSIVGYRPPLDSGALDEDDENNFQQNNGLRRSYPVIKPLISGSVDEFHKPNNQKDLRRAIQCSRLTVE